MAAITWSKVNGANMMTTVLSRRLRESLATTKEDTHGELPTAPLV